MACALNRSKRSAVSSTLPRAAPGAVSRGPGDWIGCVLAVVLVSALSTLSARPLLAARAGVIRVPLPITGSVDQDVQRQIEQWMHQMSVAPGESRPVLILEFAEDPNQDATASQFERSMALARFLMRSELANYRTVAWLPGTVSGHAVLPVMACEEIVAAPNARLGPVSLHEKGASATIRAFYTEASELRRTIPVAVAMGMMDPQLKILKATTANPQGTHFITESELEPLKEKTQVQSVETLSEPGDLLRISGSDLRLKYNFASHLASDRDDLAAKLSVPLASLQTQVATDGKWRSVRIDLVGPINAKMVQRTMRDIDEQILADNNLICFWIDSPGGDPAQAIRLATHIGQIDPMKIRTIAYVPEQALGSASLIATACQELAVGANARLGGAGAFSASPEELDAVTPPLQEICKDQSVHWSLPLALIDPRVELFRFQMQGTAIEEFLSEQEWNEMPQPDRWEKKECVSPAGEPLRLSGARAKELSLASHVVGDYADWKQTYGLDDEPVRVTPSWAENLIDELATPQVAGTLLFIAFFAMMVELSSPGIGTGAFVSTLFFAVYFWSQYLHGTAGVFEVMLFVLGLGFVAVEIFVLPGLGVFGVGGAGLVIASLVLASQTFVLPQNEYQVQQLPKSLMVVVVGFTGFFTGLFVLSKFLHRAPFLNHMFLVPPDEETHEARARRESLTEFSNLLHETGLATTRLTPAGKARFGNQFVDVVTEGQSVDKGDAVKVVKVCGNRVVVCPVPSRTARASPSS